MKNGIKFFTRTNDRHWWNIASYHDPKSITWSWLLAFGTRKPDERFNWYFFHSSRTYEGLLRWNLCLLGCRLSWQTQRKMPWKRSPQENGQ